MQRASRSSEKPSGFSSSAKPELGRHRRYRVLLRVALVVVALHCSVVHLAQAQAREDVVIDVDATSPGDALRPVWSYFGYDEVNVTTTPEGRKLLTTLAEINVAPVYVRTHFLFNTGDGTPTLKWGSTNLYDEDESGHPVYDYRLIDGVMDATTESGTYPLVELAFMPRALSTRPDPYENSNTYVLDSGSFYPPDDYEKWANLISTWASHVVERYPDAASTWQWELWNEPDIGYWRGTFDEYAELYDHTEAALHGVIPEASLGAPAVARPSGDFLRQFLEHCSSGTNYVSGETGTRLDMVSFHAKGGVTIQDGHVQMNLANQLELHRAGFATIAASAFRDRPVVISEADPDGCAACPISTAPHHAYRNSPAYGAYVVATMKRTLDLATEAGINLKGVLTWAFTFPDTPYFAGYRALSTNGIHLPVLNAFELLGQLNGRRLPATSSGSLTMTDVLANGVRDEVDVDALATLTPDEVQVLVWSYHDDIVEDDPTPVTLRVALPPHFGERADVVHIRVDESHGNAVAVWDQQGRPDVPTAEQRSALEAAMVPVELPTEPPRVEAGVATVSFDLPRFGVSLLTFTRAEDAAPLAPNGASDASCACRLTLLTQSPPMTLVAHWFVLGLAIYWRRTRRNYSY